MTMPTMPTQPTRQQSLETIFQSTDKRTNGRTDGCTDRQTDRGVEGQTNGRTGGRRDGGVEKRKTQKAAVSVVAEKAAFLPRDNLENKLENKEGTLARSVVLKGCGVHSGREVSVALHPAEPGKGIILRRTDLANGKRDIPLRYDCVEQRRLCTKVINEAGTSVSMVEHLMGALAIAQIDNLLIELDGDELPILDGSAEPWLKAIDEAGTLRAKEPRRYLLVRKTIEVREDDRFCRLLPLSEETESQLSYETTPMTSVDFLIDFPQKAIGQQRLKFSPTSHSAWREEIASARTFAFKEEIEQLRKQNFALGGSLENAVLVDEHGIVNPEGLRYKDEFVRHKILDLCGDLYLAGMPILARIEACKSGHRLNNRLLHALFRDAQAWREVSLPWVGRGEGVSPEKRETGV